MLSGRLDPRCACASCTCPARRISQIAPLRTTPAGVRGIQALLTGRHAQWQPSSPECDYSCTDYVLIGSRTGPDACVAAGMSNDGGARVGCRSVACAIAVSRLAFACHRHVVRRQSNFVLRAHTRPRYSCGYYPPSNHKSQAPYCPFWASDGLQSYPVTL